ncbi:MAG: hypothetical protein JST26_13285 [Bacteroidetes bacterium]|nr:hypothetical protein [Bacteroidota bacterium]
MTTQRNKAKDRLLETLAANKLFLFCLIVLVILAKYYSRTVLNLPASLIRAKYIITIGLAITFFAIRLTRFNTF